MLVIVSFTFPHYSPAFSLNSLGINHHLLCSSIIRLSTITNMSEITCFMFFLHGIVLLFNYNKETDRLFMINLDTKYSVPPKRAQQDYVIEVLTLVIIKSIK